MIADQSRAGYSVRGLANWILDYADQVGASVSNMALNKLIYFSLERALIETGRLLTNAKIEAWEHGPVFREVYQSFKRFGDKPITGRSSFYSPASDSMEESTISLDNEDEQRLRDTLNPLIFKSAAELRRLSHVEDGAWHRVWWYQGHANPGMEIMPESILEASKQG